MFEHIVCLWRIRFRSVGVALIPPSRQVARHYHDPEAVEKHGKAATRAINARYLQWHRRHVSSSKKVGWRPRRRYRLSCKKWMESKDNLVSVGTCFNGIASFMPAKSPIEFATHNWARWPHLNLISDQGPGAVAGMFLLKHKVEAQANITEWWDETHCLHNDVIGAYKSFQLLPFVLLTMCIQNLPHGPEKERDMRLQQMREVVSMVFQVFEPGNCVSYARHSSRMLQQHAGDFEVVLGSTLEESLWRYMADVAPFEKQERRSLMCRFMSWVRGSKLLLKQWDTLLWKLEFLCIEMDMVSNLDYRRRLVVKQGLLNDAQTTHTTSATVPSLDSKILRSCCQHAAVVSLAVLSDFRHRRLLAVMYHSASSLEEAHGYQNKLCRISADCSSYIVSDLNGGFLDQLRAVFSVLESPSALTDCEFEMQLPGRVPQNSPMFFEEDEWAAMLGGLRLNLVSNRARRRLWLFGWPRRWAKVVDDKVDARLVIREFQADLEAQRNLEGKMGKDADLVRLHRRSQFRCASIRQFTEAMPHLNWRCGETFRHMLLQHFSLNVSTQLTEDCFAVAKTRSR